MPLTRSRGSTTAVGSLPIRHVPLGWKKVAAGAPLSGSIDASSFSGPRGDHVQPERTAMPRADASRRRCAIYTRKSSDEGLEQEFNSLAAQREACERYIRSQQHEGWLLARNRYDDGGFSGGNLERPAAQRLLADIRAGRIDIRAGYNVTRLTR